MSESCESCARTWWVQWAEMRLGQAAPPLPPTVGISHYERLQMVLERSRWLYGAARWSQAQIEPTLMIKVCARPSVAPGPRRRSATGSARVRAGPTGQLDTCHHPGWGGLGLPQPI